MGYQGATDTTDHRDVAHRSNVHGHIVQCACGDTFSGISHFEALTRQRLHRRDREPRE